MAPVEVVVLPLAGTVPLDAAMTFDDCDAGADCMNKVGWDP